MDPDSRVLERVKSALVPVRPEAVRCDFRKLCET